MNPGKLRHKIKIQAMQMVPDGAGGYAEDWVKIREPYASIEPLSGRELFQAQQIQSEITHKVTIRYSVGITTEHRILFGTRVFRIEAPPINTEERNKELIIMCKEVGSDGNV